MISGLLIGTLVATGVAAQPDLPVTGGAGARDVGALAPAGSVGGPGLAILSAKVLSVPLEGPQVVDHALLLVRDGKIEALGPESELEIPEGYEVVDVGERWLAPGMIDLHCHVAGRSLFSENDLNDTVFLTNPGLRASAAVQPGIGTLERGVAGGVTTALYIPGSGSNMGGQGVLLKIGFQHYEDMELRNPGSLKLAQAGNPERYLWGVGRSFMNWNTRGTFRRGLAYAEQWKRHAEEGAPRPERNVQFEVFRHLLEKTTQVSTHTQIYQVVLMTITRVREELGLDVYIDHGSFDGWRAAARAWEKGVIAILGPREISRSIPFFNDNDGRVYGMAAQYQKEGHRMIGFNTDSPIVPEEELSLQAAMAVRYGLDTSNVEQVRGLTIIPAVAAGIADRVGSLEVGKDADILVVDGDPADPRSQVSVVWIDGQRVYDAERDGRRW